MANREKTSDRKSDHISLAFESHVSVHELDNRFSYEPMLLHQNHPAYSFLNTSFGLPLWVSSMTGGTEKAKIINQNLAKACQEFGLGMGLGSCRIILEDDTYLNDFQMRRFMPDRPLFANLGIAQVEKIILEEKFQLIVDLIDKLEADGLIIHINPMQEWMQPEGDDIMHNPLHTIKTIIGELGIPLIVKEVGQGMGYKSLEELVQLPLAAVEFGAAGGTNFALLELLRDEPERKEAFLPLAQVGESAGSMVDALNHIINTLPKENIRCDEFIVSGGISTFLDGYYFNSKLKSNSVYGQASVLLKYALQDYDSLRRFLNLQKEGYFYAEQVLRIKN